jgi:hypothetical protein
LKEYQHNKIFQNTWSAKLPWAKLVTSEDGKVHQVECKVCSTIERKDKLLTAKLDSLWKHNGRRKALVVITGVCKVTYFYMSKDSIMQK